MHAKPVLFKIVRISALVLVWAAITYIAFMHQQCGERPDGAPTVHALCPLGGLATLRETLTGGDFIKRTHPSAIILLAGTVALALIFRRAFCGWICPLGAMQEFAATIGRRLKWRRSLRDNAVDSGIRWVKIVVLVVVIGMTWLTAELVFSPYDPWATYAHLGGGLEEIRSEFVVGSALLVITLVGSLFVDRLWCRYLCPLGAFLALVSKAGATRVVRDEQSCVHCHVCDRVCPMDIRVEDAEQVTTGECITCGECVNACPVPQALQFRIRQRTLSPIAVGLASLALFFGVIGATKATGTWRSLPGSMTELVEHGGELSADNIRGFMTFAEISDAYGMPAGELLSELGLPESTDVNQPLNSTMHAQGREVEEIRAVIARHLGAAPTEAEEMPVTDPQADAQGEDEPAAMEPAQIKGTMTLAELSEAFGIDADVLIEELELPEDSPRDKPINAIMKQAGRSVSEVRDVVTRLVSER